MLIGLNTVIGIIGEIVPFIPTGVAEAKAISDWLTSFTDNDFTRFLDLAATHAAHLDKQHLRGSDPDALFASIDESVEEILAGNWKGWDKLESEHTYPAYQTLAAGRERCSRWSPTSRTATCPPGTSTTRPATSTSEVSPPSEVPAHPRRDRP